MWRHLNDEIERIGDLAAQDPAFGVFKSSIVLQGIEELHSRTPGNFP